MGQAESGEEQRLNVEVGYHVLKVTPNSPGHVARLTPFFDFIVSVGGVLLEREDATLVDALQVRLNHE